MRETPPRVYKNLCSWCMALLLVGACTAYAGTPDHVAGTVYFDPAVKGTPLTWSQGSIAYYTDLGELSPALPQPAADALVADAFSRWTSIPTAAVRATAAGQLAEDVNGSNVTTSGGVLNLPPDIQADAIGAPVAVVYDFDGSVTDTLLGSGSSADCFNTSAFGGPDSYSADAHLVHALVVLNGVCLQSQARVPDFEYHLVRVLGHVLGLGASQLNGNVWSGNPVPTPADRAGFPVMHAIDLRYCDPIANCLPNADQPRMDDRAALSRLYPVTAQNQNSFPGKSLFFENTARIRGVVRFPGIGSQLGPGMEGVNVVARWIDPVTFQPSRARAASSVSGFLFCGNGGNPITGTADALGQPFQRFGSDDPALEGYFDLAGLEFPSGGNTAQYEISIEPIDPLFSEAVGPYAPWQVRPSGWPDPIVITVSKGQDVVQDILMTGGAQLMPDWFSSQDYTQPAPVPAGGDWLSRFNVPGTTNYYALTAQANRTLSIEAQALDESGNVATDKTAPVIGMWSLAAPPGTPPPAFTPAPFNTSFPGLSRLDADILQANQFRIGVADIRGDGRPDFAYRMRVLYGDTVAPARVSAAGGPLIVQGLGFRSQMAAAAGPSNAPVLDFSANQLRLSAPPLADGLQTIVISDPATGSFTTMTDALTVGAGPTDTVQLLAVPNPAIPVGGQTVNALQFQVAASDGTPVSGATVVLAADNSTTLNVCGSATCTLLSDESGRVTTHARLFATGTTTVTATLAPASYTPPSTTRTTLAAAASSLDIALVPQQFWIEEAASIDLPLTARVLNQGNPVAGRTVNYRVVVGSGTLLQSSSATDAAGYSQTTLRLSQLSAGLQVSACVAPSNSPCNTFMITAVPASALLIEPVAGSQQITPQGQSAAPVIVRVTDNAVPPNPVLGAKVTVFAQVARTPLPSAPPPVDDLGGGSNGSVSIVASAQTMLLSDADGIVQFAPWAAPLGGGLAAVGSATADSGATVAFSAEVVPAPGSNGGASVPAALTNRATPGWEGQRPIRSLRSLRADSASTSSSSRARAPTLHRPTSSATGRPSRSPSGTRGGSSAASAPSGLRRGSRAFSKECQDAAEW